MIFKVDNSGEPEEPEVSVSICEKKGDVLIELNGVPHIALNKGEIVLLTVGNSEKVEGVKYEYGKFKVWRVN